MRKFNKLKIYVSTIFCILVFTLYVHPSFAKKKLSVKEENAVNHTMRLLQMDTENLHIAFDKKDWETMAKLAQKVHDACGGLESRGDLNIPLEFDDFRIHSENLHDYAEELIKASNEKDIDEAKRAYKKMEKTCVGCHNIFRR